MRRRGARRDAGVTTLVIAFPVLLTLVLVVFQFALYFHAQQIVTAAAEDATREAQREGGVEADAEALAIDLLAELGPTLVRNPQVDVQVSAETVRTTVSGSVARVVPFLTLLVDATEVGPRERFVPAP